MKANQPDATRSDVDSLSAERKGSEAAQDLAKKFVKHFGADFGAPNDDGTCEECVGMTDEAVAPLVDAGTYLSAAILRHFNRTPNSEDELDTALKAMTKALEPWRQK